jgi:hypothetical protein
MKTELYPNFRWLITERKWRRSKSETNTRSLKELILTSKVNNYYTPALWKYTNFIFKTSVGKIYNQYIKKNRWKFEKKFFGKYANYCENYDNSKQWVKHLMSNRICDLDQVHYYRSNIFLKFVLVMWILQTNNIMLLFGWSYQNYYLILLNWWFMFTF